MGFVNLQTAKCPACGASVQVDPSQDAANCSYCGTAFVVEKAINNYNIGNVNVQAHGPIHIERKKSWYEIDQTKENELLKDPAYREWKTQEDERKNKNMVKFVLFWIFIYILWSIIGMFMF